MLDSTEKFVKYVINELLKNTRISYSSSDIHFYSPIGMSNRHNYRRINSEVLVNKYGIPDDFKFYNLIEKGYNDILEEIRWDIGTFRPIPEDMENLYNYIQRTNKPLTESNDKKEKYYIYVVDDIINDLTKEEMYSFSSEENTDKEYMIYFKENGKFVVRLDDVFFGLPWSYFPVRPGLHTFYNWFSNLLENKYGARKEDKDKIWNLLGKEVKNRLHEIPEEEIG